MIRKKKDKNVTRHLLRISQPGRPLKCMQVLITVKLRWQLWSSEAFNNLLKPATGLSLMLLEKVEGVIVPLPPPPLPTSMGIYKRCCQVDLVWSMDQNRLFRLFSNNKLKMTCFRMWNRLLYSNKWYFRRLNHFRAISVQIFVCMCTFQLRDSWVAFVGQSL